MARPICTLILSLVVVAPTAAQEQNFFASLTGDQEPTPVATPAMGSASLVLSEDQSTLSYSIQISGLDLGGQTPESDDDILGFHIHNAPAGSNGSIVFGLLGSALQGGPLDPNLTDDDDLVIDAAAGTVTGQWDSDDTPDLSSFLSALNVGELYFNVHTPRNMSGEIRGQIIPEPSSWVMLVVGLTSLALSALKRRQESA